MAELIYNVSLSQNVFIAVSSRQATVREGGGKIVNKTKVGRYDKVYHEQFVFVSSYTIQTVRAISLMLLVVLY